MAKSNAGGGIHSKNVTRPGYRHGQQRREMNRAGVAQIGQRQGNHVTGMGGETKRLDYSGVPIIGGQGFKSELGNAKAVATVCGPGGSRQVYRTGVQGVHGNVDPGQATPKRDILSEFGPGSKR